MSDEPRQLTHADEFPDTDSLGPADVRWLRSEFAATREFSHLGFQAVNRRVDDHILAGHPHSHRPSRRSTVASALGILASIAGVAGAFVGNFVSSSGGRGTAP